MDCFREVEGKQVHDLSFSSSLYKWVPGPVVVGAGPSGLAVSACLKQKGIVSLILERSDCIAPLWQYKTYDRLRLHLPKQYCELPFMPFPSKFPKYPSKQQFISYLESYARKFDIRPKFNETVSSAEYDSGINMWRVKTNQAGYISKWLIISTGENAEVNTPNIRGMDVYKGIVLHTSLYKSGESFHGKNVLVVGCGNSGMEVCFDLCSFSARPTIVVRDAVHVLPIEVMGYSTFGLSMWLLKWLPIQIVDHILLLIAHVMHGDTSCLGLRRPLLGPLELKSKSGKTPVLDIGTLAKIKAGDIKVKSAIKRLTNNGAEFVDGKSEQFDAIILATGYKSNIPSWLKENEFISDKDGLPREQFPNGWQGKNGLYAVGLTKRGLMGASIDARKIAEDIKHCWDQKNLKILQKSG